MASRKKEIPGHGAGVPDPTPVYAGWMAPSRRLVYPKCTAQQREKLGEIARAATGMDRATWADMGRTDIATAVVEEAIGRLVLRKVMSVPTATFRAEVKRGPLRKAIENLVELLPFGDMLPPWPQMKAEFIGEDPFSEIRTYYSDNAFAAKWDRTMHPLILRETLNQYLRLMDRLVARSAGTRPHELPERWFVQELAEYWTESLNLEIKIGRGPGSRQHGSFADFVRAARELYPTEQQVKVGNLDGHIRAVAQGLARKR